MSRRSRTYKAILKEVARGGERSSLFWWLVENHDEIAAQAEGKRLRWEPLCARFAAHGLTDLNGQPPSPSTARRTWLRARTAVAEARERKRQADAAVRPGEKYPSRISPNWRPQIVPPALPAGQSTALVPAGSFGGAVVPVDAPMEFPTIDADGNQLPEGKVFYRRVVTTLQAAKKLEGMRRKMRIEDDFRAKHGGG